jgi:hypothetical protein
MGYRIDFHKMTMQKNYWFTSWDMFHISLEWMEGVSIIHGIFECVSPVEHGILQLFHVYEHVSQLFVMYGLCLTFLGINVRSRLQLFQN